MMKSEMRAHTHYSIVSTVGIIYSHTICSGKKHKTEIELQRVIFHDWPAQKKKDKKESQNSQLQHTEEITSHEDSPRQERRQQEPQNLQMK